MATFLDYYAATELVSMTLFLLCQMINDVDCVLLCDGWSHRVTGAPLLATPKAEVSEAHPTQLLRPGSWEAVYLEKACLTYCLPETFR